jgi:hypothetical protein
MKLRQTKHGDYERRINFHVFGYAVFVVFSTDMAKSIRARYDQLLVSDTFQAMHCREKGNPYSHLFFKIGDCSSGTVAHESWHVVRFMLNEWSGCEIDNESVAYHLGYLVDGVCRFRNELIDKGVGVKSKKQEVSNANQASIAQGTINTVRRLPSRFEDDGGGSQVPPEAHGGNNSGRCCP